MATPQIYRCETCKMVFAFRGGLTSHCWAKGHQSSLASLHECPTCRKVFRSRGALTGHCKSKRHGRGFAMNVYCQSCKRGFKSLDALQSHMNARGHFNLEPGLVGRTSATMNVIGSDSTQNPSTHLDGRDGDSTDHVPAMDHPPPPVPTPTEAYIGNPGSTSDGAQWTFRDLSSQFSGLLTM